MIQFFSSHFLSGFSSIHAWYCCSYIASIRMCKDVFLTYLFSFIGLFSPSFSSVLLNWITDIWKLKKTPLNNSWVKKIKIIWTPRACRCMGPTLMGTKSSLHYKMTPGILQQHLVFFSLKEIFHQAKRKPAPVKHRSPGSLCFYPLVPRCTSIFSTVFKRRYNHQ